MSEKYKCCTKKHTNTKTKQSILALTYTSKLTSSLPEFLRLGKTRGKEKKPTVVLVAMAMIIILKMGKFRRSLPFSDSLSPP